MSDPVDAIRMRVNDPRRLAAVRATGLLDTAPEEPFDRLAQLAAVTLDAPLAFVTVVDERRSYWKACIGVDPGAARENRVEDSFCQYVIGIDGELIVGDAASDARTRDNPAIEALGVAAWAGFPLRAPDGEALGSFCVVDTRTRTWTARDVDVLRSLAHAASGEIALRATAEQAAGLARSLQAALLPPVDPHVPGVDIGTAYRAAGAGTEVLGDFYDIFESGDGRWNVVLGDVCGKGLDAARMTGLARFTIRGAAMRERRPSQVLDTLNTAIRLDGSYEDRFLSAVLVALDRTGDGVHATLSSGGHTPAIRRSGGTVTQVEVPGTLLGIFDGVTLGDTEFVLRSGDVLVLYTDGVTEAPGTEDRFGDARLLETVAAAEGDAQGIADAIVAAVEAFKGPYPDDDIAVVVLKVP